MNSLYPPVIEDDIIHLENAENLINIYTEFIDEECPQIQNKDFQNEAIKAVVYAERTEQFRTILISAFDFVRLAKEHLKKIVYNK